MASISNDKAIIEELTNGSGDIHSLTAYMSYMEIPRNTPIPPTPTKAIIINKYCKIHNTKSFITKNLRIHLQISYIIYEFCYKFNGFQDSSTKTWFSLLISITLSAIARLVNRFLNSLIAE